MIERRITKGVSKIVELILYVLLRVYDSVHFSKSNTWEKAYTGLMHYLDVGS